MPSGRMLPQGQRLADSPGSAYEQLPLSDIPGAHHGPPTRADISSAASRRRRSIRPWGKNSFARKPSGVIGTSPGAIGTAVAQQCLRGVLCFCNSPLMNTVEAYIQFKPGLIAADGEVTDEGTKQFLQNYMTELHAFIVRVLTMMPRTA